MPPKKARAGLKGKKVSSSGKEKVDDSGKKIVNEKTVEDDFTEKRGVHLSIIAKVVIGSTVTKVYAASADREQYFMIHKELLALHSGYFRRKFREASKDKIIAVQFPHFEAPIFANFCAWLYSRLFMQATVLNTDTSGEELYALCTLHEAPAAQNLSMEEALQDYGIGDNHWMDPESVASVYGVTGKGSLLRKLCANVLNWKTLEKITKEDNTWWGRVFQQYPDIKTEMKSATRQQGGRKHPWDIEFRDDYMTPEIPLRDLERVDFGDATTC